MPIAMPLVKDPETLPPPVRAGIGLVAAGVDRAVDGARKVRVGGIGGLATLPLRGIALVASARETVERTYEEMANRGETILARWRHQPEPRQTASPIEPPLTPVPAPAEEPIVLDATPGATLAHDDLPLADYDHLTLGSLRARLPKLDLVALVQIRDYERTHANRLPVLTMLDNRIAKVQ
jgi:hypothetical protein